MDSVITVHAHSDSGLSLWSTLTVQRLNTSSTCPIIRWTSAP